MRHKAQLEKKFVIRTGKNGDVTLFLGQLENERLQYTMPRSERMDIQFVACFEWLLPYLERCEV